MTNYQLSTMKHFQKINGIALVAVLAILVVLAIMASTFTVLMNIENKQSKIHMESHQLDMLVSAGLEHAKAMLTVEELDADRLNRIANTVVEFSQTANGEGKDRWMYIKDGTGKIIGRYRIRIEDEAAKVNVQKAFLTKNSKGTGWDTGEVVLPRALGVNPKTVKKIIDFRYGKNKLPGARGDDDQNNLILMADGIDNNANGIIDEEDEGINDPKEYNAEHLKGDDRKFSSMTELMNALTGDKNKISLNTQNQMMREIPHRATIYSCDMPGSATLPNETPSDINCMTTRECRRLLIKANAVNPFEPNSVKQMQLAANLIDYRDENHVLSTLGSTYGVEAICFNEILANDETTTIDPSYAMAPFVTKSYWREICGSSDGGRMLHLVDMIYNAVPADAQNAYAIDPRKAWRIDPEKNIGKIRFLSGDKAVITFPQAIGKKGTRLSVTTYYNTVIPEKLPGPSSRPGLRWSKATGILGSGSEQETLYRDLLKVLKKLNSTDGDRPRFPKNYFRNSLLNIYQWANDINNDNHAIGCFKILSGDQREITISTKDYNSPNVKFSPETTNEYPNLSITVNSWSPVYPSANVPRANRTYLLRARKPESGKYFKIMIVRPAKGRYSNIAGYPDELGVSGNIDGSFTSDKDFEKLWVYNDGKPVKTKAGGWMKIMITSSPEADVTKRNGQFISYIRILGAEVVEMYNASATPISLANWRVICNTGSLATQIGRIRSTEYYDQKLRRGIVDDNPVVQPRGHFYLVNDKRLFDANYGNADEKWGSAANEQVPVFQMDEQNWGVTYKIKSTRMSYGEGPNKDRWGYIINIDENGLDKEIFNLETIKFVDKEGVDDDNSWNNVMAPVLSHFIYKKNEIFIRPIGPDNVIQKGELVGKSIMVLGMPHSGGIVSLTLKNEYDQVCARTVDYGKVDVDELEVSTEKIDPTKNTWIKRQEPSIGGTENKAGNRAMHTHHNDKFFIKNGPYCSIGEARNISTGNDFERLGGSGDISKGVSAFRALSKYMSSSHKRLESCLGDVTRVGWNQAYDEVARSSLRSVQAKTGGWKLNKWAGHTLRFLTGPLRGEKYPIISNSKKTIILAEKNTKNIPRSAPNRKAVKPNAGDKFTIGPGYATPMCYTRKSGESATWTWENVISFPGTYDLYIYGLNDAIDTTEFLEENNNVSLDVEVWNYETKEFDILKKRGQYGKQDSFNAGKIKPENISGDGSIKIRLTAHNVIERNIDDKTGKTMVGSGGKQTGIAWFNYAVVTPVPVPGRVNINTAQPRLLASLPGMNSEIAKNIFEGLDRNNKKTLKPYQNLGDVLKVKNMTPDIFERCVNILSLDSTFFTVEVEAQLLKKNLSKEKIIPDVNSVTATRIKRFVINADRTERGNIDIYELERYPVRQR